MMRRIVPTLVVSTLLALAGAGCGRPPQIGGDKESFKAVDALYTAVSLRDPALVDQCRATLKGLHEAGKMPPTAFASLEAIIDESGAGRWEVAVSRLARFMEGQRR